MRVHQGVRAPPTCCLQPLSSRVPQCAGASRCKGAPYLPTSDSQPMQSMSSYCRQSKASARIWPQADTGGGTEGGKVRAETVQAEDS